MGGDRRRDEAVPLRLAGLTRSQIATSSSDVDAALAFWSDRLAVHPRQFGKPILKRHNPRPVRRNTGEHYHGCLAVYVRRSGNLNLLIAGWWDGLAAACGRPTSPEG